jgi:hypothetical protein
MAQRFVQIGGSGMVAGAAAGDSKDVERHKAFGKGRNITMHEILVALSLSALAFMPCLVTMDENECDMEETA